MTALYAAACIISFLIVVIYIGFYKKKDMWFLMTFISLFFCNTGYLTLAISGTLEEALLANRIAYLGSVFLPFFLFITIMKVCKFKFPRFLPFVLSFINAGVLFITASPGYLDIYYKSASFEVINGVGILIKEYGILHPVYYIYLVGYFGAMIAVIVRSFFRKRIVSYKHALFLAVAVLINIIIYFTEKTMDIKFEFLAFSYIITAMFLLLLYKKIQDYSIDGILQDALKTDSVGVILFDGNKKFKGCNDDALDVLPELNELKLEYPIPLENRVLCKTVLPILEEKTSVNPIYSYGEKIYRLAAKPFHRGGAIDGKPLGAAIVITDDTAQQEYLQLISSYNEKLEAEVAMKTRRVVAIHDNMILGMADMVEGRDPNTGGHIKRTSSVVEIFVNRLKLTEYGEFSPSFLKNMIKAAPMHDLGKIAIDDAILRKPGKYTGNEYTIMKTHAPKGAEIVGRILNREDDEEFYDIAINVAHYHHEKYDGSGYPEGLSGESIPVEARIMALADVFDALVSKRCYKEKYSYDRAFEIIRESLGQHFDPQLGELFLTCGDKLIACYDSFE